MLRILRTLLVVAIAGMLCGACGGVCDKAVDNQLTYIKAEGTSTEKKLAEYAEAAKELAVKQCERSLEHPDKRANIECKAQAPNLAALKACDGPR